MLMYWFQNHWSLAKWSERLTVIGLLLLALMFSVLAYYSTYSILTAVLTFLLMVPLMLLLSARWTCKRSRKEFNQD